MPIIVISIGSNVEPEFHLRAAVRALRREFDDVRLSPVYQSKAVGFDGADFLNLVASARTDESLEGVVARLRKIEAAHGRERPSARFSPRTLDLDLLLYGDEISAVPTLRLPRAEITQHAFVLRPLADLLPKARHPLLGQTYAQLWSNFHQAAQPIWPIDFDWSERISDGEQ